MLYLRDRRAAKRTMFYALPNAHPFDVPPPPEVGDGGGFRRPRREVGIRMSDFMKPETTPKQKGSRFRAREERDLCCCGCYGGVGVELSERMSVAEEVDPENKKALEEEGEDARVQRRRR